MVWGVPRRECHGSTRARVRLAPRGPRGQMDRLRGHLPVGEAQLAQPGQLVRLLRIPCCPGPRSAMSKNSQSGAGEAKRGTSEACLRRGSHSFLTTENAENSKSGEDAWVEASGHSLAAVPAQLPLRSLRSLRLRFFDRRELRDGKRRGRRLQDTHVHRFVPVSKSLCSLRSLRLDLPAVEFNHKERKELRDRKGRRRAATGCSCSRLQNLSALCVLCG